MRQRIKNKPICLKETVMFFRVFTCCLLGLFLVTGLWQSSADDASPAAKPEQKKTNRIEWVDPVAPNKHWNRFLILPWQLGSKTRVMEDKEEYERVNLRGFHIQHGSTKYNLRTVEFAKKTGWPFYLGHACRGIYLKTRCDGPRRGLRIRKHSLADPATFKKMTDLMGPRIRNMAGSPIVAVAFDDEISMGRFASPVESDASPVSLVQYREWLSTEYNGDIKALNAQYGTDFKIFDAVMPIPFEKLWPVMTPDKFASFNLSQWCDWRSAMDTQFAVCLRKLTEYANSIRPDLPAGFVGGQYPSPWGGYDFAKLRKVVQWVEYYDICASRELVRSFWDQKRASAMTWFPGTVKTGTWSLWYHLCHGGRVAIVWPSKMMVQKDGKRVMAPVMEEMAPVMKEIQGKISTKIIDSTFLHDPIAVYYSHPSVQVNWALDSAMHGDTWHKRLSSMDGSLSSNGRGRVLWLKTLEDLGYQGKFVAAEDVAGGSLIRDKYKVLILQRTLCLSEKEAKAIRDFVNAGGTVIADNMAGLFDNHGKALNGQGRLDDLFGIRHDLTKGLFAGNELTEINGEKDWRRIRSLNLEHGCSLLAAEDITDWQELVQGIVKGKASGASPALNAVWKAISVSDRETLEKSLKEKIKKMPTVLIKSLNRSVILNRFFSRDVNALKLALAHEGPTLAALKNDELWAREAERLNRRILEALFPKNIRKADPEPFAGNYAGMAVCERGLSLAGGKALAQTRRTKAPVVIRKGRAVYLNLSPICYQLDRDSVDGAKWRNLIGGLLKEAGLEPRALVQDGKGNVLNGFECIYWQNGERTVVCVLANKIHKATVTSFSVSVDGKPFTAELVFKTPVRDFINERTGKKQGDGKRFSFPFKPWEASVFSFRR